MEHQFLPSYTLGEDAYDAVPQICGEFGKTAVIIGGNKARAAAEEDLRKSCKGKLEITDSLWYGDDATFENADALKQHESVQKSDMIFAVGGGRAIDTVKKTAGEMNKPLFVFPTLASNCAPVTAVGAYYYPTHAFRSVWYAHRPSYHTFINTRVIAEAPTEYFWAGIGDALSKQYEVEFSSRGDELSYRCRLCSSKYYLLNGNYFKLGTRRLQLEPCARTLQQSYRHTSRRKALARSGNCMGRTRTSDNG